MRNAFLRLVHFSCFVIASQAICRRLIGSDEIERSLCADVCGADSDCFDLLGSGYYCSGGDGVSGDNSGICAVSPSCGIFSDCSSLGSGYFCSGGDGVSGDNSGVCTAIPCSQTGYAGTSGNCMCDSVYNYGGSVVYNAASEGSLGGCANCGLTVGYRPDENLDGGSCICDTYNGYSGIVSIANDGTLSGCFLPKCGSHADCLNLYTHSGIGNYCLGGSGHSGDNSGICAPCSIAGAPTIGLYSYENDFFVSAGQYTAADLLAIGFSQDSIQSISIPEGYIVTIFNEDNFLGKSYAFDNFDYLNNAYVPQYIPSAAYVRPIVSITVTTSINVVCPARCGISSDCTQTGTYTCEGGDGVSGDNIGFCIETTPTTTTKPSHHHKHEHETLPPHHHHDKTKKHHNGDDDDEKTTSPSIIGTQPALNVIVNTDGNMLLSTTASSANSILKSTVSSPSVAQHEETSPPFGQIAGSAVGVFVIVGILLVLVYKVRKSNISSENAKIVTTTPAVAQMVEGQN